jgi:HK97 gp10 family phage protein
MINIDIALSGDMMGALDGFAKDVEDKVVMAGVAAMGRVVYDEVKLNAHKLTISGNPREKGRAPGTLESAIYRVYSPERSSPGVKVYKVSVNKTKAPHWFLLEFGWSRAPAHPYIRPAMSKIPDAIRAGQSRMSDRIDELIAEKAGGL